MSEEEILSLNGYLEDLYQAMQIGNIVFKANHSFKLYNLINKLLKENQELKKKINTYENPEDLTLMFMYCDEKAKDKIKCLEQENQQLKEENEKYKEVINKLSKSIDGHYDGFTTVNEFGACNAIIELLLEFKEILKEVE